MVPFKGTALFLLAGIFTCHRDAESWLIRRFNYDARLYEHFSYDSRYIQFSRTEPDEWMNIPILTEARNFSYNSMICTSGPGAWIFYPDPMYMMGNSQRYYLVIGERCVRSDDIESIQPLGKMNELFDQGVTLFPKSQFGATQIVIDEGEGSGEAGSLIFTGATPFMISGGSEKICLTPGSTKFQMGYCLIPDLKSSFGIEGSVSVKEGCDGGDERTVVLHNCYHVGVHEIYTDSDLSMPKLKDVCGGGGDMFSKSKFMILMEMWGKRLASDVIRQPMDYREEDQVKLSIIWNVLDIFRATCPAVESVYIHLLGHLFVKHMKKYWNSGNETIIDPVDWNDMETHLETCNRQVKASSLTTAVFSRSCRTADQFEREPNGGTPVAAQWYEIVNGEAFDTVIEQMWLIINHVIPTCNTLEGYITNDWNDWVLFFHQAFLDPLQDVWADPGDWMKVYTGVFHGYDSREQHQNVVSCLEAALRASPEFDPIGRPKSFRNLMLYKYAIPNQGEISSPPSSVPKEAVAPPPPPPPPPKAGGTETKKSKRNLVEESPLTLATVEEAVSDEGDAE